MGRRWRTRWRDEGILRLNFDRRLMLRFRDSLITSDAGLLTYCELDSALALTDTVSEVLADACTAKNARYPMTDLAAAGTARPGMTKAGIIYGK
jgi:hypothetical protein